MLANPMYVRAHMSLGWCRNQTAPLFLSVASRMPFQPLGRTLK